MPVPPFSPPEGGHGQERAKGMTVTSAFALQPFGLHGNQLRFARRFDCHATLRGARLTNLRFDCLWQRQRMAVQIYDLRRFATNAIQVRLPCPKGMAINFALQVDL